MPDYRTILVPYDFSDHSKKALAAAVDLGRRFDSNLHLLHVVTPPIVAYPTMGTAAAPPPNLLMEVREAAERSLNDVAAAIEDPPGTVKPHIATGGATADAIREAATTLGADLIVMGTHGRTGMARVFLGSVAERTLRLAPCPVLTVRAPEEAEED
jgi:nucleotide-binding universal stress UspA family protein